EATPVVGDPGWRSRTARLVGSMLASATRSNGQCAPSTGCACAGSASWEQSTPTARSCGPMAIRRRARAAQRDVLVDGAAAFPRIAEAIAGARDHVHITGWHVAPEFELGRGEPPLVLGQLLAELAERVDVRVLVWAGASVPLFHPTRSEVQEAVRALTRRTRI